MRSRSTSSGSSRACADGNTSAPISLRSWPVITTSCASGASAETTFTRSVPTLTQVPVVSLKSSATRPSKTTPRSGSASSASSPASPMR
jgi:hypothetical protein